MKVRWTKDSILKLALYLGAGMYDCVAWQPLSVADAIKLSIELIHRVIGSAQDFFGMDHDATMLKLILSMGESRGEVLTDIKFEPIWAGVLKVHQDSHDRLALNTCAFLV